MVITFSNIKGSAGGGGATGGTVSGITLWSDETTKAYIDDALSGVTDVLSAYTKTEDFATINGSAITSGGNLVIEATPYTAGTNIDITDHIISVTGITVPTKVSELVNDEGYITTADTQNFVTSGDVQTQIDNSISGKADSSAVTAQINEVKAEIEAEIPSKVSDLQNDLNFASTGDVESMISGFTTSADVKTQIESYNYINSGQAQTQINNSISNKVDNSALTQYYTSAQTDTAISNAVSGKMDTSAISAYTKTEDFATINGSAITSGGNIVVEETPYSGGSNIDITDHIISVTGITIPTSNTAFTNDAGYVNSGEVETQITNKDYPTKNWVQDQVSGKLDTDVFTAYTANTKTELDNKQDISGMTEYATTAFTESTYAKIGDIPSLDGYATTGWVESQGYLKEHQDISGKLDSNVFTAYTANTQTELDNKQDASAMTAYYTSAQTDTAISNATNGLASEEWVESQGYLKEHQDISGKLDSNVFTAYTANTKTELDNKQDASAMTAYATTAFTESTYLKEHQSLSAYSTTEQVQTLINTAKQEVENEIPDVSDFVTSAQVNTQIESKGYITGYTETDPVFMASPASGISEQDITNWDSKLDASSLDPYYTSAETDNAIINAVSGKADLSAVTAQIGEVKAEIEAKIPSKVSSLENDLNFVNSADVKTQVEGYNYINSGQAQTQIDNSISGKLDSNVFTTYTSSTQTELDNKQDISGMTEYATTAFTESTYAKTGDIPTNTSDLINDSGFITSDALSGYATEQYVDNSISGKLDTDLFTTYTANTKTEIDNKQDASAMTEYATTAFTESTYLKEHQSLSAYTPTSGFSTINGSAITSGDNLVIEETPYSGGTNIEISNHVISVTGITVPTKLSELTNDEGYVTSGEVETQITDKGYITTETDPVFMASAASGITSQDINNWNAKLDSLDLEPYYTSAQTDTAIDNAVSGKVDSSRVDEIEEVTASALVELNSTKQDILISGTNIKTINNESILGSGNIEIQGGSAYTAGANIDISTDNVISVTGITVPTKLSELTNDEGFVNSGEVETQIESKGYITGYTETDPVFQASAASGITSQDITNWNGKQPSGDYALRSELPTVPTSNTAFTNDAGYITDAALNGYATTAFTEQTYLKEHQSLSAYTPTSGFSTINGNVITDGGNLVIEETSYSAGTNIDITGHIISVTGITVPKKLSELTNDEGFVNSGEVETQIASKGYITGYTETDPVFMASAASGITSQDINNWNAKLDSLDLEPYYTSAQTDTAINNAVSGKADSSAVTAQISEVKAQIEAEIPTKVSDLQNDLNFVNSGDVKTQIEGYNYINSVQAQTQIDNSISGKLDTDIFTTYTANTQTELNNKQDISGMTEYATTAFTENTYAKIGDIPTKTSDLTNDSGFITNADIQGFVSSGDVQTQIDSSISGKLDTDAFTAYTANTKTEIDNAVSGKVDSSRVDEIEEVTASALVELNSTKQNILVSGTNIKTINNESILGSGNIVIQGGSGSDYSAGANIDITNNVISVTGITIPTSNTAFTNDAGYVNSGEVETQITSKGYITGYTETDPVFQASAASGITSQDITNWNNKLDSSALNPYYTSAETDSAISNAVSGKTDKVSVTASGSGYKFPKWNNQGCITGTSATAYQAFHNINGSSRTVYSDSSEALPTIYAPTSEGLAGQPLLSNGSGAPVWGAYKFQFISKSQYDALATKDSTTIYFIVNEN